MTVDVVRDNLATVHYDGTAVNLNSPLLTQGIQLEVVQLLS